jgi:hypothetical protein
MINSIAENAVGPVTSIPIEEITEEWWVAATGGLAYPDHKYVKAYYEYCKEFNLRVSKNPHTAEAVPTTDAEGQWYTMLRHSGIRRLAIESGLFLFGGVSFTEIGDDLAATASAYFRPTIASQNWLPVSTTIMLRTWAARDMSYDSKMNYQDQLNNIHMQGDWAIIPEVMLTSTAEWAVASAALGYYIDRHITVFSTPPRQRHAFALKSQGS